MASESSKTSSPILPVPSPVGTGGGGKGGVAGALHAWWRVAFVENAALKFVALVLALTVFVLVQSEESEVYHPWVRVTYSQGDTRVLTSPRVDQVQISVRGTRRRVKRLQKRRLENIHVDLAQLSTGELRLDPEMFTLPEGVELVSINPPSIYLEFDERDEKSLPVTVDIHGTPVRGFKLGSLVSKPTEVRVSGARRIVAGMQAVMTEKIDLTGRTQNFKGNVKLVANDVEIIGSPEVDVSVQIIAELEARQLEAQKVVIRTAETLSAQKARFRVEPASVVVTMYGAVHALEAIAADKVEVYVEISSRDLVGGGPRQMELKVEPMLSDIAYKIKPTTVTLQVAD